MNGNICKLILKCYNSLRLENIENYIVIGSSFLHFNTNFSKEKYDGQKILHLDGKYNSWHKNSIVFICPVFLDIPNWSIVPTNIVPNLPFQLNIEKIETIEQAYNIYDIKYFYTSTIKRALNCEPKKPAFLGRKIHAAGSVPSGYSKANLFVYFSKSMENINDLDATFPATSFISREKSYNESDQVGKEIKNWLNIVPKVSFHTSENEKFISKELKILQKKKKELQKNEENVKQKLYN